MAKNITEKEKKLLPELVETFKKLSARDQEKLVWIGEGILISGKHEKTNR